ncbi:MAG: molybdopterin-guanine dinucleotide biosynthesis protein B [Chloroflexota bacterium]|nr:molybdopterin-guanine dinucleotide biosynthesis protein B [Chloroflexota bacterium]MDE2929953.1 molybdopterin-guanine dinucleotide biosynthesis protein B [Chloroflexota bacterium]
MIPVVCIVGKHNAGKTTLIERMMPCLHERGRRVAIVKHAAHGFKMDHEGSDSWRLSQTDAVAVLVSGPGGAAFSCKLPDDATLPQILALLPMLDIDLVLVEGHRRSDYPKIEVHRAALGSDLLVSEDDLIAIVTENDSTFSAPSFHTSDPQSLAAFLNERFPHPNAGRDSIRLTIDGEEIPTNAFASAVISGGIRGMLAALKGVGEPGDVRIELRRGHEADDA